MKNLVFLPSLFLLTLAGLAAERPNVVMIAVDDLRPMLGCYGDKRIQTPNFDLLASRSVLFERAYCQVAKCGPSRLSLMTGLRPASIGVFGHADKEVKAFRERRPDAVSVARWFKDHGYHTRSLGKIDHDGWQLRSDWSDEPFAGREQEMLEIHDEKNPDGPSIIAERWDCPVMQGPDVPDDHFFAARMTDEAIRIHQSHDPTTPLFLAVGYRRPHLPFIAPKRYHELYQPDESWLANPALPPAGSPPMAWFNSDGYTGGARRFNVVMPKDPKPADWMSWNGFEMRSYMGVPAQGEITVQLQLELLRSYAACISYVDTQLGRLLDAIDLEQTIIVLWADHGWHLGEHSAWGKMTNFEIATRVPLMIAAPGIKPGRTRTLAELVDLYPTLCDLTGIDKPGHIEGESLLEILKHPARKTESIALSEYPRFKQAYLGRALRTDRYRYVQWRDTKTNEVVERELYDHQQDPGESRNLAASPTHQATIKRLDVQLNKAFKIE